MKIYKLLLVIITFISIYKTMYNCINYFSKQKALFNLNGIKNKLDYNLNLTLNNINYELFFNFCSPVNKHEKCVNDKNESIGVLFDKTNGKCFYWGNKNTTYNLTLIKEPNYDDGKDKKKKNETNIFWKDDKKDKKIGPDNEYYLNIHNENKIDNFYNFAFNIHCKKNEDFKDTFELDLANSLITVNVLTSKSCSYSVDFFEKLFSKYEFIFFIVFVVIGIILCFFGKKFYKLVMYLIGFIVSFLIFAIIFGLTVSTTNKKFLFFLALLLFSLVAGFLLGMLLIKIEKINAVISSGLIGYIIALTIFLFFLKKVLFLHIIAGVLIVILIVLNFYFYNFFKIFNFAVIGGYLIGRFSMSFFSKYINEVNLVKLIVHKQKDQIGVINYISWGIFLVCAIAGLIIQIKLFKINDKDKETEDYDEYIKQNYHKL